MASKMNDFVVDSVVEISVVETSMCVVSYNSDSMTSKKRWSSEETRTLSFATRGDSKPAA